MNNRRQVDSNNPEWSQIDYQLQLITGKSSLKIISLYRYSEDQIAQQDFKTDMIIQTTDFNKDFIERVTSKGIPLEDLILYCGHVNIHPNIKPNKVFTFLMGKANLGRMGTLKEDVTQLDSMLIESEAQKDAFQYNFFIRSHAQYQIRYEVNFTIGDQKEFNPTDYPCTMCQNKTSTIYCRTQQYYFCEECSRDHHKTRLMQSHQLERVDKINTLPLCKTHNQRFSNYCLKCQKYLCTVCLQKGNSHGNSDHPVFPIQQIYQQKRENNQILPQKQRDKLESLLRSLQMKREEIDDNYKQTKKYLEQQFEKSMATLNQLMQEKVAALHSDQLDLRMMVEKLEWSKAFIKFQQKNLKPIFYIQSQQKFEQEIVKFKISDFQSIFNVKGDIVAEGEIIVGTKDMLDRSRRRTVPQTSRTQPVKQAENYMSNSNILSTKQKSLYDYNATAELPQKGELSTLLQSSKLNFFCLTK